ncbi:hypothetical protein [Dokdonia sp. 4H-3-7-5]|uniref:hypothetical protein n=1 Tax=Dokdonia sp. (strain 4H-3-7-5) TaxID=983548 RepID=UPI00020A7495|nr:hypothetical protein [Dokdonia sp. 4H-3-7-5]AEE18128.1 hypothetical protein Krodi_0140 [Dokdonia sp. 4H-3-7-5]
MEKITSAIKCRRLPLIIGFVILINIIAVITSDMQIMRMVRLLTIGIYISYYLFQASQKSLIVILILFGLLSRDIAVLYYETSLGHKLYLILGVVAYATICLERGDILKVISRDRSALIFTFIFIVLNTFALNEITKLVSLGFQGPFEPYLFYVYGVFMIIFGATAIIYNQVYNSNRSLAYILFMISFLTSDVTSLFAYYFGYEMLFYVDCVAYAIGLGLFSYTVIETSSQLEEAEQYDMLS